MVSHAPIALLEAFRVMVSPCPQCRGHLVQGKFPSSESLRSRAPRWPLCIYNNSTCRHSPSSDSDVLERLRRLEETVYGQSAKHASVADPDPQIASSSGLVLDRSNDLDYNNGGESLVSRDRFSAGPSSRSPPHGADPGGNNFCGCVFHHTNSSKFGTSKCLTTFY